MNRAKNNRWHCEDCNEYFRRGDGTHCPDCGVCDEPRGHMECQYPSNY